MQQEFYRNQKNIHFKEERSQPIWENGYRLMLFFTLLRCFEGDLALIEHIEADINYIFQTCRAMQKKDLLKAESCLLNEVESY